MNATIHVASILAIALTAFPTGAQISTWSQLAPVNSPSGRLGHAMAYDATRQRVVLFGGSGTSGVLGDTWEWDGTNWLPRFSLNYPSARVNHAMAYDAARQRVVLFGGSVPSPNPPWLTFLGGTWEWDGINWVQRTPVASPSSRTGYAMAYDAARQRVVLFGGSVPSPNPPGLTFLGDTWEWDGINWVQRTPVASPSSRTGYAMGYDTVRQRTVLFGGYYLIATIILPPPYPPTITTVSLNDTWEWDGTTWTQGPAGGPYGSGNTAAYDTFRQRVVAFAGSSSATYEWDGNAWTWLGTSTPPSPRSGHAMANDEAHQRIVLFGGSGLGDTWVLDQAVLSASATAYGAGCGSPALGFVPDANGRPLLGQAGSATIVNAPTPVAAVAMGWSNQFFGPFTLPVTLAGIGMPGCDLQQSADILGLGTSPLTPSTLSFSLAIPSLPSLIGLHIYLQAYAFAPGVNPLQIIISNGIDWLLGNV